ncbi:MAG: phosphate signaling complex PhoU family protein [Acidimicrobiales bacterium]
MARTGFSDDLEGLRLQVELMALRVGEAVFGARQVLATGDVQRAREMVESDDAIDEMQVSLTEQCYQLLAQQAPVAADLRLVVSVIRVLHELERIGDLSLRVANAVDDQHLIAAHPAVFRVLLDLADNVVQRYEAVRAGWSAGSIELLDPLRATDPLADLATRLVSELRALVGPDAVRVALAAVAIGRSFDRIGDHTQVMACRLQYLVTGDPAHLADEVAW